MTTYRIVNYIPLTVLLLGGLMGCLDLKNLQPSPDSSRIYFLGSDVPEDRQASPGKTGPTILIGPSSVAKFLDRPQIITFDDSTRLEPSEYHLWGEPLEEGINRLLVNGFSAGLDTTRVGFLRVMSQLDWDYRVGYHVYQLGGPLDGTARLQVSWWIHDGTGEVRWFDSSIYEQSVEGDSGDYASYVRTLKALVESWAAEVVMEIQNMED